MSSPGAQPGRARRREPLGGSAVDPAGPSCPVPIYPCRPWRPPDRGARRARSRLCRPEEPRDRACSEPQGQTARRAAPHSTSGALGAGLGYVTESAPNRLARPSAAPEVGVRRIRDARLIPGCSTLRDPTAMASDGEGLACGALTARPDGLGPVEPGRGEFMFWAGRNLVGP